MTECFEHKFIDAVHDGGYYETSIEEKVKRLEEEGWELVSLTYRAQKYIDQYDCERWLDKACLKRRKAE